MRDLGKNLILHWGIKCRNAKIIRTFYTLALVTLLQCFPTFFWFEEPVLSYEDIWQHPLLH